MSYWTLSHNFLIVGLFFLPTVGQILNRLKLYAFDPIQGKRFKTDNPNIKSHILQ